MASNLTPLQAEHQLVEVEVVRLLRFTFTTATTADHQSVEEEVGYLYYDLLRSTPTTTTADHSSLPLSQLHQSTLPQSMLSPTIKTVRMRMRTMVMINNSWNGDDYHDSNT